MVGELGIQAGVVAGDEAVLALAAFVVQKLLTAEAAENAEHMNVAILCGLCDSRGERLVTAVTDVTVRERSTPSSSNPTPDRRVDTSP